MCHVLHNLTRARALVAYVFALVRSLSTQVKEMYRGKRRGDKDTHEASRSFYGKRRARNNQMYKLNVARSEASHNELQCLTLVARERKMPG